MNTLAAAAPNTVILQAQTNQRVLTVGVNAYSVTLTNLVLTLGNPTGGGFACVLLSARA